MMSLTRVTGAALLATGVMCGRPGRAEVCTTQSQMSATDRSTLAATGQAFAAKVQANDVNGLRAALVPEYAKDFGDMGEVVAGAAAKTKDGAVTVEQVYLLDASQLKSGGEGQFFCSLNKSPAEVNFTIAGLLPGRYGFVIANVDNGVSPWKMSFLLKQGQNGQWQMAGFYPKPMTAAGHDGLWYWTQARTMASDKEQWNAWLYYQEAANLLTPVGFMQSTHLETLRSEQKAAAPPTLSEGVSAEAPLVVKGADGTEYHFTALDVNDSLGRDKVDVSAHLKVDAIGDVDGAKKRNAAAMEALVTAYPELRKAFHGVWVVTEEQGRSPFATEEAMTEIH